MEPVSLTTLAGWANFYVIVGSSAGALTGLQFVVITLISEARMAGSMREIRAFGTPTVVHFCVALLVSATMSIPWHTFHGIAFCIGIYGIAGVAYAFETIWHARKAEHYTPDAGDWFWYTVMPLVAYAALAAGAILLWWHAISALFLIAATTLLFLFIAIHNAWDTVTYIAVQRRQRKEGG